MTQDQLKQAAAQAAVSHIIPHLEKKSIIGIGTGSTVNHFIDLIAKYKMDFEGVVASSEVSTKRLKQLFISVYDLNSVTNFEFYLDGADEVNRYLEMIKGGGGALTREKIIAAVAKKFICIADESKMVNTLGSHPLPVEVIPMARSYVAREIVKLGGDPIYREGFITDNGNVIIDVHHLTMTKAADLEEKINNITGVVCNGLFVKRPANLLFLGTKDKGVQLITP